MPRGYRVQVKVWKSQAVAILNMNFTPEERFSWHSIERAIVARLNGYDPPPVADAPLLPEGVDVYIYSHIDFMFRDALGEHGCDAKLSRAEPLYDGIWIWTSVKQMRQVEYHNGYFFVVVANRNWEVWKIPGETVMANFYDR